MSLNLNVVHLAGNLTRDPELKTAGASTVCSFGLAINRRFTKADGTKVEEATFVDIDTWGKTAEMVAKWFRKGAGMMIEGRLKLEGWETKDGEKRQRIKVVAERVHFTTSAKPKGEAGDESEEPAKAAPRSGPAASPVDDEPPF